MLTKKDLQLIEEIMQRNIKNAFRDFYDNIFEPYANKNEKEHEQMISEIKAVKKDTEEVKEHSKDHDKRIRKLEDVTSIKW